MKRLLTAVALIPIILYVVLAAHSWVFLGVVIAVALLCYREYNGIAAAYGFGAPGPLGYGFGLVLLGASGNGAWGALLGVALTAFLFAMRDPDLSKGLPRASLLITGVIYIFGCWKCAVILHEINPHWLMFALLLNWVGDAGAYYIGRALGKHKLAPRVSPNKTWEGAIASVVFAVLLAGAYIVYFAHVSIPLAIAVTAAANIAGQLGDLAESAMKRGAGVKDSGNSLPGHGGWLDRVDSTLFAMPVIWAFLKIAM
jgi:phosphatidate cytidylyltransferase